MFLDLLDTVKTSQQVNDKVVCEQNRVQGEAMLYYLLLMGKKPTLTLPQVMDSNIILNIAKSKYKHDFYKLIEQREFKISLYGNYHSVRDYFCKALLQGVGEEKEFFNFSSLYFLEEYDKKIRANLHHKIVSSMSEGHYDFKTDGISNEHITLLEEFANVKKKVVLTHFWCQ